MNQLDKEKLAKIYCRDFAMGLISFETFKRLVNQYDLVSSQEHIRQDYDSLFNNV